MPPRFLLSVLAALLFVLPAHAQRFSGDLPQELALREANQRLEAQQFAARVGLPMRIEMSNGTLAELVAVEAGRPLYLITHNVDAATTTRTTALHGSSYGLQGTGMRIGIWDGGAIEATHLEFRSRLIIGDNSNTASHATHVGGTVAASGSNPAARGMAPRATVLSYDWTSDEGEMAMEARNGLLVSNHSYGFATGWERGDFGAGEGNYWWGNPALSLAEDARFGMYDEAAASYDRIAATYPYYLPVVSAGNDRNDRAPSGGSYYVFEGNDWARYNTADRTPPGDDGGADGFDSISAFSLSKNVLTVGSIADRVDTGADARASSFSSAGPTDDGRIKPDLVGNGESLLSSTPGNNYGFSSGTSMSSPNVAGSLILLQELHERTFGQPMRAASLKALALHTAEDVGLAGPDYLYGWGLLHTQAAADQVLDARANRIALFEGTLGNTSTFSSSALVEDAGPVRITLAWTDPAGDAAGTPSRPETLNDRSPVLKNDLDVRLIARADGTVYQPYVLDPNRPSVPATTGDNVVDNVEQVYAAFVPMGTYAIVVTHKGALVDGEAQDFTLVVSGARDRLPIVQATGAAVTATVEAVSLAFEVAFTQADQGDFVLERAVVLPSGNATDYTLARRWATAAGAGQQTVEMEDALVPAGMYRYRLTYVEQDGRQTVLGELDADVPAPEDFLITRTFPNPFSVATTLELDVPTAGVVRVDVFDVLGRQIATPLNGRLPAARHRLSLSGARWASGTYFVRVQFGDDVQTHRVMLVR